MRLGLICLLLLAAGVGLLAFFGLGTPGEDGNDRPIESVQEPRSELSAAAPARTSPSEVEPRRRHALAPLESTTQDSPRPQPQRGLRIVENEEGSDAVIFAGVLLDAHETPVAAAQIDVRSRQRLDDQPVPLEWLQQATDAEGAFRFRVAGGSYSIEVRHEDRPAAFGTLYLDAERETEDLRLVLPSLRTIEVLVMDDLDQPVSDAELFLGERAAMSGIIGIRRDPRVLELRHRFDPYYVRTDDQGLAQLTEVPEADWSLEVRHPEFNSWLGNLPPGQDRYEVRLRLDFIVEGVVHSWDGGPLPGALVRSWVPLQDWSYPGHENTGRWIADQTDGSGRFELENARANDSALLFVSAAGHSPKLLEQVVFAAGMAPFEIYLEQEKRIRGIVLDSMEKPVPNARILLRSPHVLEDPGRQLPGSTWEALFDNRFRWAGFDGRFEIRALQDSVYELEVWKEMHPSDQLPPAAVVTAAAGTEDLVIHLGDGLEHTWTLAGRVQLAPGTEGPEALQLTLVRETGPRSFRAERHRLGLDENRFRLEGLEPGRIKIRLQAPGFANWEQDFRELGAGLHAIDPNLIAARSLHLRLLQSDGTPAAYRRLIAVDRRGVIHDPDPGRGTLDPEAILRRSATDQEGRIRWAALPLEAIRLWAGKPEGPNTPSFLLDLTALEAGEQTLYLP